MVIADPDKEWEKLQKIISELNAASSQSPGDQRIRAHMRMNAGPTTMDKEQKRIDARIKAELEATKRKKLKKRCK